MQTHSVNAIWKRLSQLSLEVTGKGQFQQPFGTKWKLAKATRSYHNFHSVCFMPHTKKISFNPLGIVFNISKLLWSIHSLKYFNLLLYQHGNLFQKLNNLFRTVFFLLLCFNFAYFRFVIFEDGNEFDCLFWTGNTFEFWILETGNGLFAFSEGLVDEDQEVEDGEDGHSAGKNVISEISEILFKKSTYLIEKLDLNDSKFAFIQNSLALNDI